MTLSFGEWIEVTENLPACIIRDDLIDRVDNTFNGHRLTDPLYIDLGRWERALVNAVRYRMAVDTVFAVRSQDQFSLLISAVSLIVSVAAILSVMRE